jgi:hypothetical protein
MNGGVTPLYAPVPEMVGDVALRARRIARRDGGARSLQGIGCEDRAGLEAPVARLPGNVGIWRYSSGMAGVALNPANMPAAEELAESQAILNEFVAYMIMGQAFNEMRYLDRAVTALLNFNHAGGFELCEERPPDDVRRRQLCAQAAVRAVRGLEALSRGDVRRARFEAGGLERCPVPAAAGADGTALVYLITHAELGAAKVGISDASGLRLAQHRREGWQILAVFQVRRDRAAAVETGMLKGWRQAGMPSYLTRSQMPQGGWTETVALERLNLGNEVTRLCKLAAPSLARR